MTDKLQWSTPNKPMRGKRVWHAGDYHISGPYCGRADPITRVVDQYYLVAFGDHHLWDAPTLKEAKALAQRLHDNATTVGRP